MYEPGACVNSLWLPLVLGLFISTCAGKPPLSYDASDPSCPDLTGSYCSTGLEWEDDSEQAERSYLPYYLGVESAGARDTVTRVDINGPNDEVLKVTLYSEDKEVTYAEFPKSKFICEKGQLALEMAKIPWGGAGPFLALGGSGGWRVAQRGAKGNLHIAELRRETGVFMLVVPLRIRTDTRAEFSSAEKNDCELW